MEVVVRGLSSHEAAERRARDGPNTLPAPAHPSALRRLVAQLVHFFALMLWVAGALAFVAGMPALGMAIFVVIVLNAIFAFGQESRAGRAAERLRHLLPLRVNVRRNGVRIDVDASEVVVGDLVLLEAGDRIPADAMVVAARAAWVDTSLLTGESEAAEVDAGASLFAGAFLVEGEAEAEVTAIGAGTRLAGIARLTTTGSAPESPLTKALQRVVRTVALMALGVGLGFFLLALGLGNGAQDGFVFAIGVTVALVPEALLPTVTLALAWGAEQMAHRKVLVRNLDAVETLGSTTFICTDKTGTLTQNQMTVVEAWTPEGRAHTHRAGYDPEAPVACTPHARASVEKLAFAGMRCSVGYLQRVDGQWRPHGDPTEVAVDVLARRLGIDTDEDRTAHLTAIRFPFDSRRRRMSVVFGGEVLVKGAPDAVLPLCDNGSLAADTLETMTEQGLRVLAVASRATDERVPATAEEAECGLTLLGLVAMQDPPREGVRTAIDACRKAGVRVAMITGDHPVTAAAIATVTGLHLAGAPVLEGSDLPADEAALGELVDVDGIVLARVSPEDKLRIARALRARGHVVAMTGDGVNDGPALHEADIGIAMGQSGTDVAREAADLVLLDDRFDSIVAGIEQGRATFVNMRRFLTYHLTDNVAELTPFVVWALSGGRIPLALGVLQILALDIGTDTLSATALGAEPPAKHLLEGPPVSGRLLNGMVARRAFGLAGPTIALMTMLAFFASFAAEGWRPGDSFPEGDVLAAASGAAFMTVVIAQSFNAFACRSSTKWPGALGWTTNHLLIPAVAIELLFSFCVLFIPPIADELGQAPPPAIGWVVAALAAVAVLAVDALDKWHRRPR